MEVKVYLGKRVDPKLMPIEVRTQYEVDSLKTVVEFIPLNPAP